MCRLCVVRAERRPRRLTVFMLTRVRTKWWVRLKKSLGRTLRLVKVVRRSARPCSRCKRVLFWLITCNLWCRRLLVRVFSLVVNIRRRDYRLTTVGRLRPRRWIRAVGSLWKPLRRSLVKLCSVLKKFRTVPVFVVNDFVS